MKSGTAGKIAKRAALRSTDAEWPEHLRDAESRLLLVAWDALENVTGVSFDLVGKSATDDAFLRLLGDALHGFHTHVERPDEYLLLWERNKSVPLALAIAVEKAEILGCLCQVIKDALVTEQHFLANHGKNRKRIADALEEICAAVKAFNWLVQMYPRVPKKARHSLSVRLQSAK